MTTAADTPRLCLVTGATGFIGSALVEALLAAGHRVRITCRSSSDLKWLAAVEGRYEKATADLTDTASLEAAVKGCQWVFHLGGMTTAPDEATYNTVNGEGTANVFAAAQTAAADTLERFIYVSSVAASGPAKSPREPRKESDPGTPPSMYGRSKLLGETRLRELSAANTTREWPWVIVRPPAVYGPRDKDVYEFFLMIKRRLRPGFGFPQLWSSVIHVTDLVEGLLAIARADEAAVRGEVFVLASPQAYPFSQLMRLIQSAVGRRVVLPLWLPIWALFVYAAVGSLLTKWFGVKVPLTWDKCRELNARYWVFDVSKVRERAGWQARISSDEGLKVTADWYREHRWL
ncbi:MAG: NAD-dependent epimerase/dehydratase family protein [Planctomycetota bacterium]